MPINVLGSTSQNVEGKIDKSLFAQKPYLRTIYIEGDIEENIDLIKHFRIKSLPYLSSIREATPKFYLDTKFNDPSKIGYSAHVDFYEKMFENVRFVKVNFLPAVRERLTPKFHIDNVSSNSLVESSLLRLDPNEESKLDEQDALILSSTLTAAKTILGILTKAYIDSLSEKKTRYVCSIQ